MGNKHTTEIYKEYFTPKSALFGKNSNILNIYVILKL